MTKKTNHILTMAAAALMLLGSGTAEAHNRKENTRVGECREYVQDVWSYGRKKTASGVACYRGRGQWEVVSSNLGTRHYHVAGPIVILPERKGKGHNKHGYYTYKTKQKVIVKPQHHKGWAYQQPVKNYKKKQNNYHGHHRDDDDGITIEFKW